MERLEVKHISPYLQYKLLCNQIGIDGNVIEGDIRELRGIEYIAQQDDRVMCFFKEGFMTPICFKPILNPLNLQNEITHNGEIFRPIIKLMELCKLNRNDFNLYFDESNINFTLINLQGGYHQINDNNFFLINKLFEWHIDVFKLIPKGLAIDINTLK